MKYGDARKNASRLIQEYNKNFAYLIADIKIQKRNQIVERILSVDFSEIYSYIFYTKTLKNTYRLLDTVFNIKKDCEIVLTPPAIYELINYYETMKNFTFKYNDYEKILNLPEVNSFCKAYDKYNELINNENKSIGEKKQFDEASKMVIDSYERLVKYGNKDEQKIGGLAFLLEISTPEGSRLLLDDAHYNLKLLLKNNKITSLDKALDDPGRLSDISMDLDTFRCMRKYLDQARPDKYINNVVDAELAALSVGFNQVFKKDKIAMNVFTNSKHPCRMLERIRTENGLDLIRGPMYGLIRFSLYNITDGNYDEMYDYSSNCFNLLNDFDILNTIYIDNKDDPASSSTKTIEMMLKESHNFLSLLFYDHNLGNDLINAIMSSEFNEVFGDYIRIKMNEMNFEKTANISNTTEREIDMIAETIYDPKRAEEKLAEAQERIRRNIEDLYQILYKYIDIYDCSKTSPSMYRIYRIINHDRDSDNI